MLFVGVVLDLFLFLWVVVCPVFVISVSCICCVSLFVTWCCLMFVVVVVL